MREKAIKFSDSYIKLLKPKDKMYQKRESRGFGIRVLPTGTKIWTFTYTIESKRRQMTLGHFDPDRSGHVSLADAHAKYRAAYDQVEKGIDPQFIPEPVVESAIKSDDGSTMTVDDLVELYKEHMEATLVERSVYDQYRTLTVDVLPAWRGQLIRDIKRPHAIKLLEDKAKVAPGQANNILKTTRTMFSYALERQLVESNPFASLAKVVPQTRPKKRRRFLDESEIKYLWNRFLSKTQKRPQSMPSVRRASLLTLVTGQRPGEMCSIEWNDIEYGQGHPFCKICTNKCAWLTIPPHKIKTENRRDNDDPQPFRVFLTPLAVSLLPEQSRELRDIGIHWVFYSPLSDKGYITENSLSQHIQRLEDLREMGFIPHDLRRTTASHLPSIGCSQEIIDRFQNHAIPGVGGIYNRYKYDDEKRHWALQWSLRLQEIVG